MHPFFDVTVKWRKLISFVKQKIFLEFTEVASISRAIMVEFYGQSQQHRAQTL